MTTNPITNVDPATGEILALPGREDGESNFRYLERLMEALPEPEGDRGDELTGKILQSGSLQEENDVWESKSSKDLVGRRFIFRDILARPSDSEGGLELMLVCFVEDPRTHEPDVVTTGSVNVCASLVRAKYLGQLPAEAEIRGPKREVKGSKIPLHLHWLGKVEG